MIIEQEDIYKLVTESTGISFLQSTGLALDPKWQAGMTTHVLIYNEGRYQVPTYEEAIKIVYDVKPKYGKKRNCNDHAFRDKVNVVDYCLDELGFEEVPAYGIMYVSPFLGRGMSHCVNVLIHTDTYRERLVLRMNDPQNTRMTNQIDRFLCHEKSSFQTIPHLMIW